MALTGICLAAETANPDIEAAPWAVVFHQDSCRQTSPFPFKIPNMILFKGWAGHFPTGIAYNSVFSKPDRKLTRQIPCKNLCEMTMRRVSY
jgi:hypothetical protein